MARSIIAKRLQLNDEEAFRRLLREVLYGLHGHITTPALDVEFIVKLTGKRFASYFQSPEAKEEFQAKMTRLDNAMKDTFEFVKSFYWYHEVHAPYGEQQWDELFMNLKQGVKRRMVEIQQMVNDYTIPEFSFPADIAQSCVEIAQRNFGEFHERMSEQLAKIHEYLDEDYLETILSSEA